MDPSWSERDRSDGPPQGRCAPAIAGRLRRSLPRPVATVVGRARSGRRNGPFGRTKEPVLAEPGGRWSVGQSGVWPSGVVMAEPIGKSVLARLGGGVGLRVGPLAQAGLDEPLGLTVGARGVGLGAEVAQRKGTASLPPMVAAISRAVVGHDALDGDAVGGEPGERALEKRHRAFLALVAQHLAKGQARGIINADVEVFPASAAPPVAGIAGDAVPNRLDTAELLDIDMDQLAWPLALVAHRRRFVFERRQPAQPEAAQDLADRRNR